MGGSVFEFSRHSWSFQIAEVRIAWAYVPRFGNPGGLIRSHTIGSVRHAGCIN
jgi:hypothetical protein